MPRFFFNIRRPDGEYLPDDEGMAFADLDAARRQAVEGARNIMEIRLLRGEPMDGDVIEITDPAGYVLDVVRFEDAVWRPSGPDGANPPRR